MRDELLALLERHCVTIRIEAENIANLFHSFETKVNHEQFEKAIFLVHKLKGSSGALGFLAVSKAAHTLEFALRDFHKESGHETAFEELRRLNLALQLEIHDMHAEASSLHLSAIMANP